MHHFEPTQSCFVLLQDGVYLGSALHALYPNANIYCLSSDTHAAGQIAQNQIITDAQWVELCCQQNQIISIQ